MGQHLGLGGERDSKRLRCLSHSHLTFLIRNKFGISKFVGGSFFFLKKISYWHLALGLGTPTDANIFFSLLHSSHVIFILHIPKLPNHPIIYCINIRSLSFCVLSNKNVVGHLVSNKSS